MIENDIINEEYCRILQSKHFDSEEERDRFINSLNDDFHTIPVADPLSNAGGLYKWLKLQIGLRNLKELF
jgi:hypothetical protein